MHEEKPTFKDLLRKHKIALGAVAAQAGVEIRIAYKLEQKVYTRKCGWYLPASGISR